MKKYIGGMLIVCLVLHSYVRHSLTTQKNNERIKFLAMRLKQKKADHYA